MPWVKSNLDHKGFDGPVIVTKGTCILDKRHLIILHWRYFPGCVCLPARLPQSDSHCQSGKPGAKSTDHVAASPAAILLPAFDEYTVAYKDRSLFLDPLYMSRTGHGLDNVILVDGVIAGKW